jgi:hypothetical protein
MDAAMMGFSDEELKNMAEEAANEPTSELVSAEIMLQQVLSIVTAELQRRAS